MLELIKERMKTVKNGKAAGKNEVTGEMIKSTGENYKFFLEIV